MTTYQPVSCMLHSRLELAILRHKPLIFDGFNNQGEVVSELQCTALDIYTSHGAEYLRVCSNDQQQQIFRLDQLKRVTNLSGELLA